MEKRIYNILFDLHTVSGIIISVALYVIFLAGTISFLREDIIPWERHQPVKKGYFGNIDFNKLIYQLTKEDTLYSRDISFYGRGKEKRIGVFMSHRKDISEDKQKAIKGKKKGNRNFFMMDGTTAEDFTYEASYTLGEFFYRLHFFAHMNLIGRSGYTLAGLVAFFFLFALITGIIVHWDKITTSFYVFRPGATWKTIWTDSHVGLGLIGFPYQFMFALTGCYFIIGSVFMVEPVADFLSDEKTKAIDALDYQKEIKLKFANTPLDGVFDINDYIKKANELFPEMELNELSINNFGDKNMFIVMKGNNSYQKSFVGGYHIVYKAENHELLHKQNDENTGYIQSAEDTMARLHFGDFGGYGMKIMYILLGFMSCYVILSGVMIWFVARDKKSTSEKKRKMNKWVANSYLSICLSMLPTVAFTFTIIKVFGHDIPDDDRKDFIYKLFFYSWLAASLFFIWKGNNQFTNKANLLLLAVLALSVPIADGFISGKWLWDSYLSGEIQIFAVNIFWLLISIASVYTYIRLKTKIPKT